MSDWSQRKAWNNDGMDPDWRPETPNYQEAIKERQERIHELCQEIATHKAELARLRAELDVCKYTEKLDALKAQLAAYKRVADAARALFPRGKTICMPEQLALYDALAELPKEGKE
jgi:uncharacterized small protein (DUF1192 family)